MLAHILHHKKNIKAFVIDMQSIVYDFVVRPEYTILYLRALDSYRQQLGSLAHQIESTGR